MLLIGIFLTPLTLALHWTMRRSLIYIQKWETLIPWWEDNNLKVSHHTAGPTDQVWYLPAHSNAFLGATYPFTSLDSVAYQDL